MQTDENWLIDEQQSFQNCHFKINWYELQFASNYFGTSVKQWINWNTVIVCNILNKQESPPIAGAVQNAMQLDNGVVQLGPIFKVRKCKSNTLYNKDEAFESF